MVAEAGQIPAVRGSFSKRFLNAAGDTLIANLLAVAGLCCALAGARGWLPLVLGGISLAVSLVAARANLRKPGSSVRPTGSFILSRSIVAILAVVHGFGAGEGGGWLWLATGIFVAVMIGESPVNRVARGAIPYAQNLPGIDVKNYGGLNARFIFPINSFSLVLFCVLATLRAPVFWLFLISVAVVVPTVVSLIDGIFRVRARRVAERKVNAALRAYEPVFAVHWDAPQGTAYQLAMWMPFLDRLGEKYIVIVRNGRTFSDVVALTHSPVLLRTELADMDEVVVSSLKAAFYVNTATKNAHFVRYTHITHIQLNHGDSDKAPSYNPVFRMFDKNFVAGQAAIDRFAAHGVHVPRETFSIVGRPQVESIDVNAHPVLPAGGKTVLYAPTWAGFYADSNYSSLPVGHAMIEALLARGCTIIFRPHPYTGRSPQLANEVRRIQELLNTDASCTHRAHVWGQQAETRMSIVECFNAADTLLADVSSVVPDFLYSEKPFAIVAMTEAKEEFIEEFPIARAAYIIEPNLSNLPAVLDDLLHNDPLVDVRRELKTYYLGDFPAASYAQAFLDEARRFL